MTSETPLDLSALFADVAPGRPLTTPLPAGRLVVSEEEEDDQPLLWLSDGPPAFGLWAKLRAEHAESGLWPLLLEPLRNDENRPWVGGELMPGDLSSPDDHDGAAILAGWWSPGEDGDDRHLKVVAPFGREWPGLTPELPAKTTPEQAAGELADVLASFKDNLRLGLVAAPRGADALTTVGWTGPVNHVNDTAEISAVLRTWEDRFGARVVGVGFDTLYVSVANPPTTPEQAQRVAAEHYSFCPDNIDQGEVDTLTEYAERLVDAEVWSFWWD